MSDEPDSKPKPSTQQEFNLAAMEAIRHLAEYTVKIYRLAGEAAVQSENIARTSGQEAAADSIRNAADEARKSGLRYHNAALDLWEAFQKDAGDELVRPRELPPRQNVDD